MGVPVGIRSASAAHRLRRAASGNGSDAPVDNTMLIGVLSEELAFSKSVLVYALPLLRLLLLDGLVVGLPVASAVRKGFPLVKSRDDHSLLLAPDLEPKERHHCNE